MLWIVIVPRTVGKDRSASRIEKDWAPEGTDIRHKAIWGGSRLIGLDDFRQQPCAAGSQCRRPLRRQRSRAIDENRKDNEGKLRRGEITTPVT
jgi:hypothetical protein